jgi:dephospho-CoA kinase
VIRLGLTGSIGMGKTTTAAMFAARGVPVWDADSAVHALYAPGGAAVGPVGRAFPQALRDGAIDRDALRRAVAGDAAALARLEGLVHPLVAADRRAFLARHAGAAVVLLDVPLLFETGAEVDRSVVVTAPAAVQRARVLARGAMTPEQLDAILARQMPDADKRARADYVVETVSIPEAEAQVDAILADLSRSGPS